jgi:spore maturation protein CgeB
VGGGMNLDIVIFGLSITSSWGNGHAATYRALAKALARRGHRLTFLERDAEWYRANRDLVSADYCNIRLYDSLNDIPRLFGHLVDAADLTIVGSYVPDGIAIGEWVTARARGVTAFYDIDTPVTLAGLETGSVAYIAPRLIPRFDIYLSFTGGPVLSLIEDVYGSPRARVLYCAAEPDLSARSASSRWTLGYLGTYSIDRQPALEGLLLEPARALPEQTFVVAGAQYPAELSWPANVTRIEHVAPEEHAAFYSQQRYTLNLTRAEMVSMGYSPSIRLFESAAFGVPVISDRWAGIEQFFTPGEEILIVDHAQQVIQLLNELPDDRRRAIAAGARKRLARQHTPEHRARTLEEHYREVLASSRRAAPAAEAIA